MNYTAGVVCTHINFFYVCFYVMFERHLNKVKESEKRQRRIKGVIVNTFRTVLCRVSLRNITP